MQIHETIKKPVVKDTKAPVVSKEVIKDEVIRMLYADLQKARDIITINALNFRYRDSMMFIDASLNVGKRFIS